jgi:YD repeat-containing protein
MQFKVRNALLVGFTLISLLVVSVACSNAASATYVYDELNRLRRAEYTDGTTIEYTYDEVGNRSEVIVTYACDIAVAKVGSISYPSIQAAYDAAGNGATIKCRDLRFTENLTINRDIAVTLEGGYNCAFTTNSDVHTPIKGSITTTPCGGTITIKNFTIEN